MKKYQLVCFNAGVYENLTDAENSGAVYCLDYQCKNLRSKKTLSVVKAAYKAANCLDGNHTLVVFAIGINGNENGGLILPKDCV